MLTESEAQMRTLFIGILLLSFTNVAGAEKLKIYKWLDDKGVVTFSEYRPETYDYEELEISGDIVEGNISDKSSYNFSYSQLNNNKPPADAVSTLNQQANDYCEKAKHNINILESFEDVKIIDADGNPSTMSKEEVEQQKKLANRQIELFCRD